MSCCCCCYLCNTFLYNNQCIYRAFDKNFFSNRCRVFCINNYSYTENYKLEKNCESKIKKLVRRTNSLPIIKNKNFNNKQLFLYNNKIYNVPTDHNNVTIQIQKQPVSGLYKSICVNNIYSLFNKCYSYVKIMNHYSFNYNL